MTMLRTALIGLALLLAVVPTPADWVERTYSTGIYRWLQRGLTPFSNAVPFALLDVAGLIAFASLVSWWIWRLRSSGADERLRAVGSLVIGTATIGAVVYVIFLATWGFNYRRVPLTSKLDFASDRVTEDTLRALADESVTRLNALHDEAVVVGWPELVELPERLGSAFARVQQRLPSRSVATPGIPKSTLLTAYFRLAAVDGMIDPFFLEVLVNGDVLPFERPFVVAHEWGHLAGFADESEASFVGWLVCLEGDTASQYSGWLFLYPALLRHLPEAERAAVAVGLDAGPRLHLEAIRQRWERSAPRVRRTAARVYDRFLKANRVSRGIASYGAVVRLVLGTRFDDAWRPAWRTDF